VRLAVIAAVARNRVIGNRGTLPWHIPEDLRRFKRLTTGHAILMGRKTFISLGRPLPNRRNVVLTSHPIPDVECYPSIDAALNSLASQERVFVIGGGQIYAQLLGRADELFLTLLDRDVEGDTYFPPYEDLVARSFHLRRQEDYEGYSFLEYLRVGASPEHSA
jgi:dihydrofolate reductase